MTCVSLRVVSPPGIHEGPLNWTERKKRKALRSPRPHPWSTQLPNCMRKESFWKLKASRLISMCFLFLFLCILILITNCTDNEWLYIVP